LTTTLSLIALLQNSSYLLKAGAVSENHGPVSSLDEISIRGLGVIESAVVEFSAGLTVLTGETGAGKTMVLSALGLVLGAKGDTDLVRTGSDRTVVSAKFSANPAIVESVLDSGGDVDGDEVLLTRTISAEGKSRISIGGALSTATKVAEIAEALVEIHGQSTNLRLSKPAVQREVLDSFVGANVALVAYQTHYEEYRTLAQRIAALKEQSAKKDGQIAELKTFVDEFAKLMPKPGELVAIDDEINRLGSVEELNSALTAALNLLEDEDRGVVNTLQQARRTLEGVKSKDSVLDSHIDKYTSVLFDLTDVMADVVSYLARLEANPQRFDQLQQRKAGINSLLKKFGEGSDRDLAYLNLIARYESAEESLADLTGGDQRIAELETELGTLFKKMKAAAKVVSDLRAKGAAQLSKLTTVEMQQLSMPNSQLICEIKTLAGEKISDYGLYGLDEVSLLFAGHSGAQPLPLSKVASGGEVSRVMLALSVVIAESSPIGTYIFDEVDAGVGGAAAVEVGRRLKKLSQVAQVIVVTHLAQVAVWGDSHLLVQKDQTGSVSASDVKRLNESERKVEIARMLSGQAQSATAQEHAAELLELVRKSSILT
jgi:DNA repair protein RecN (Recombination protein N)